MKNRIKGCKHHETKVVEKFARGGMAGGRSMNDDKSGVAGPRSSGAASRSSGGTRSAGGGMGGGFRQGTNNNDVGPRGGRTAGGLGLTTGKTWTGNTAYGPAGGKAMGFTRTPAEAKARMSATTRPKLASPPTSKQDRQKRLKTAEPLPSIPRNALMYAFGEQNFPNQFAAKPNPYPAETRGLTNPKKSKRDGVLGDGWDERVPADPNRKTTSGVVD